MKFYISTTGIKRVTISSSGSAVKGSLPTATASRRIPSRTVLPVVLVLGIALPFLFVRIAFLVLESAAACSSPLDCIGWRFFTGDDASMLREELTGALVEATTGNVNEEQIESFNELVKDMTSKGHDIKAFAFKTKAMLLRMEHKVQSARQRESIFWHLASHGVPKSLHCLCLKLAEEYAVNSMARSLLPPPEYVSRLADPSFLHLVLLTDNVLAASVVVSSTIQNSANPGKLVFHIVTDKKTYTPMHAWFAINSLKSAVVEVKGLHQYDWSQEVNVGVKQMLEIHRLIWKHNYNNLNDEDFEYKGHKRYLEALSPSSLSLLNHLRIYIPELFPDLNKILFLDDDIVVQHDIASLLELDLKGKVVGAVVNSWCGDGCCPGRKYRDYLNFSHPIISSNFDHDRCAWLYGMNIFDIEAWRRTNITATYHQWLELSLKSGLALWHPGVLPPSLIAFEGHVHPIDPSWHVAGLGYQSTEIHREILEDAAVIHFSGPAKPWLEIGFPEVRSIWNKYVSFSNKFIRECRLMG
ncbi:probable galacturonosyltransferase 15 isoform X2 [Juglans regia]|uniref:Hexosyltransferase n=1 Tax=Juglans regia TaxID=51240 RepID=A0A6P9F3Q3_JUGRE|nr:probable galacturonosyltransferase 15 isoform X2 [Juglans regia]